MKRLFKRLGSDQRGAALIELAFCFPVFLAMGGYGVEIGNLAITNMRVSQIALTLADNASRIGVNNGQNVYQLQEGDLDDVLQGARLVGAGLKLTTYGRVTISSLENIQRNFSDGPSDSQPVQRVHWQRCVGMGSGATGSVTAPLYDSNYGRAGTSDQQLASAGIDQTTANAGNTSIGLGAAPVVTAPSGAGVIFVEINYQYQPVFGTMFTKKSLIHYVASFIVRDKRDFSQIYSNQNALGTYAPRMTCDLHNA